MWAMPSASAGWPQVAELLKRFSLCLPGRSEPSWTRPESPHPSITSSVRSWLAGGLGRKFGCLHLQLLAVLSPQENLRTEPHLDLANQRAAILEPNGLRRIFQLRIVERRPTGRNHLLASASRADDQPCSIAHPAFYLSGSCAHLALANVDRLALLHFNHFPQVPLVPRLPAPVALIEFLPKLLRIVPSHHQMFPGSLGQFQAWTRTLQHTVLAVSASTFYLARAAALKARRGRGRGGVRGRRPAG